MRSPLLRHFQFALSVALACAGGWPAAQAAVATDFLTATLPKQGAELNDMPYRLLVPTAYSAANSYPLIVFLHASGERGTNNTSQLNNNANGALKLVTTANQTAYPCFMLAPQANTTDSWNATALDQVMRAIELLKSTYSIDPNRIYVTGVALGGTATWDIINRYPFYFAAAVPLSANKNNGNLDRIAGLPLWVFHAANDTSNLPTVSDGAVSAIRQLGGRVIYTRYATGGQSNTWQTSYGNAYLLPWMMAQRRNQSVTGAPSITLTTPANHLTLPPSTTAVSAAGTAAIPSGVTKVNWTFTPSVGDAGVDTTTYALATGTDNWSVTNAPVDASSTLFLAVATGSSWATGTGSATGGGVTTVNDYFWNVPLNADVTVPTLAILTPTRSGDLTTTATTLNLTGTAAPGGSKTVKAITWRNNRGGEGLGLGTTTWRIDNIDLQAGENIITVTVRDSASITTSTTYTVEVVSGSGYTVPEGFDVQGYLSRYPAIQAEFGTDLYGAWLYYRDYGIYAGEIFDESFRVSEYLALYPELAAVFGTDLRGALLHWLTIGRLEGRIGRIPLTFSSAGYFSRNADVALAVGYNPILAWQHFWLYGIYEGRAYDNEFRVFEYLALNPDLQAAFLNDWRGATLHWLVYGKTEGRLGRTPLIFNVTDYLAHYPDVGASWGNNPTTVWQHYWLFGINESRTFDEDFRVEEYLALNPDLAAQFGTDRRKAFMHWVRYGQSEGRLGRVGGGSTTTAPSTPTNEAEASRFLIQASFGPNPSTIGRVLTAGYAAWVDEQIAMAPTYHLPYYRTRVAEFMARSDNTDNGYFTPRQEAWWQSALAAPDQLRQRMAFALSEILVISQDSSLDGEHEGVTQYYDILVRNAFGNYRQLLEEVTLSPMMGQYLSMIRNRKPNPTTGSQPDENYAREIMQLFTIGLSELNLDGTLRLDADGLSIPTYTQPDIVGLAHVFTGWGPHFDPANPPLWNDGTVAKANDWFRYGWDPLRPMTFNTNYGDLQTRTILGGVSVPSTLTGPQRLTLALDTLFNHPNVGPFLARHLIQRFVTSNPSPAYISRVASSFNNNGTGVRGDLGATLRAVLLDPEARRAELLADTKYGKLTEPLMRMTRLFRAFPLTPRPYAAQGDNRMFLNFVYSMDEQSPLFSPTVFNFFKPGYAKAGPISTAGLVSPEFQIYDDVTAMIEANRHYSLINSGVSVNEPVDSSTSMKLDFTEPLRILAEPGRTHAEAQAVLVEYLNQTLLGGNMSPFLRSEILNMYASLPTSYLYGATEQRRRVQAAVYLILFSPDFNIQR